MNETTQQQAKPALHQRLLQGWKTWAIIAFFAVVALSYFSPAVFEGRDLFQNDVAGASGTAQDVRDYNAATGETAYWTNSLFGGMPMYQIAPSYPSIACLKKLQDLGTLQWPLNLLPSYSWLLFAMLVGFYIFMRSLKVKEGLALFGAIMWAFSSYFIILIDAGHIWKLMVLSFIPPTIAGIVYAYEGKYLKGGVVTTLFAALQLMSNHVQMSYYFAFVIAFIVLSYLFTAIRSGNYQRFLLASLTVAVSAVLSVAINLSNIYHTYQYTQETMRGGSALSSNEGKQGGGGLDKDYITAWSYGKAETLTFLIPNLYGGATGALGEDTDAMDKISNEEMKPILANTNHYWGDQPFTSGPVYVGAFVLCLAVLGAFIVRTPLKWALLAATVLSLFLGWGHNFMWFSDLFIDYFPLYNKFRTVSSILVIAEFTIPTLAILGLIEFLQRPEEVLRNKVAIGVSVASTLGVAFIIALAPNSFFSLLSGQEEEMFRNAISDPRAQQLITALKQVRSGIVSADAWRSVLVLAISLAVCWAYTRKLITRPVVVTALTLITFLDLWMVNKRYLNDGKFIDTALIEAQAAPVTPVDEEIKKDKDPHYRVLNLSVSTFNDATTSYSHRSVGGYHAAKLGRYQDLIDKQIATGNKQVLNMLDTRYIIARNPQDPSGGLTYQRNEEAQGAAWLIAPEQVLTVSSAKEEMNALSTLDLRYQAVVDKDQGIRGGQPSKLDSITPLGDIKLTDYRPGKAVYSVDAPRQALAVFSEIYYPHGWTLTLDGKPIDIKRANYLLRAAEIPQGKHTLEMTFDPQSIHTTELISYIAQAVLVLMTLAWAFISLRNKKNTNNSNHHEAVSI